MKKLLMVSAVLTFSIGAIQALSVNVEKKKESTQKTLQGQRWGQTPPIMPQTIRREPRLETLSKDQLEERLSSVKESIEEQKDTVKDLKKQVKNVSKNRQLKFKLRGAKGQLTKLKNKKKEIKQLLKQK